jgi:hypothetical protein
VDDKEKIKKIYSLLESISSPSLDDIIGMAMIGVKKGRQPHVRKIILKFIELIKKTAKTENEDPET